VQIEYDLEGILEKKATRGLFKSFQSRHFLVSGEPVASCGGCVVSAVVGRRTWLIW
jgi:hypothetical protein